MQTKFLLPLLFAATLTVHGQNLPGTPHTSELPAVIGGRTSTPTVLYKVDPEYSDEARQARYSGTVLLELVVDGTGRATDVKIVRPLGLGLNERAIEAVGKWRFKPGTMDDKPVDVRVRIEVTSAWATPVGRRGESSTRRARTSPNPNS